MPVESALPEWIEETCVICPGRSLELGAFDVVDRPGHGYLYSPEAGYRVGPDGAPTCVHPYRVGLPPAAYASRRAARPDRAEIAPGDASLELPIDLDDLEGWLIATIRRADPDSIFDVVGEAEAQAARRFPPAQVVEVMRRVLSRELARL